MALYYFPITTAARVVKIAAPNPPAKAGWVVRAATEAEQAQIDSGQTYWTPSADGGQLSAPPASKWKVSKDTIISRIAAANKLTEAAAIYAAQSDAEKFAWDGYSWFWSDNQTLATYAQVLGISVSVLLARDPEL
jgi:hypothetical protein